MADNPNHHHYNNKPLISGVHADIDFMDIDGVMVVPDTPDRISKQPKKFCEISSYDDSSLRNFVRDTRPIRERRNRFLGDSIHSAGMYSHPEGNLGDGAKNQGASSSAIPLSSSSSRNVSVSGMLDDKIFKHKDIHHHNDQERKVDRVSRSSFDRISHHHNHRSKNPVLVRHGNISKFSPKFKQEEPCALKMGNVHLNSNKTVCLNAAGASKSTDVDNNGWIKVKVDHDSCAHGNASSMKGSDNICIITSNHDTASSCSRSDIKGKVKVKADHDELIHSNAGSVNGNGNVYPIGTACDTEKGSSHSFRVPNANRKRLVRNGCISPNNIMKAKKKEDVSGCGVENVEGVAASGSSHPIIDVNEVTSNQNDEFCAKGKGLLIRDSSSTGHAKRRNDAGNSTNEQNKGKSIEDCIIVTDTHGNSSKSSFGRRINLFPSTSSPNNTMPSEVQFCTPSASFRRPKRISGSSERSKEVICLSSGGKSSTVKPLREHGDFPERELGSSSAREDFCGEERESNSQTDNNSEAREIQLQADEMLARELQEQLYNETPIYASGERAVSLGGEELQEDALLAAFSAELDDSFDRFVNSRSLREQAPQPPRVSAGPQSLRARLFRGRSLAQLPRSNISRIRNQLYRSRGRRNHLSHMDVETRMHFLESLEAVYNEDRNMVDQLLNSDREFGENDYEMLLALDENNHAHLGASVAQISNLPVSTVNNDNCEICSICLETPVIGDTVRHLPCLHKFHKDCIDPWLRRKRSCPVCKSDI